MLFRSIICSCHGQITWRFLVPDTGLFCLSQLREVMGILYITRFDTWLTPKGKAKDYQVKHITEMTKNREGIPRPLPGRPFSENFMVRVPHEILKRKNSKYLVSLHYDSLLARITEYDLLLFHSFYLRSSHPT